MRLDRYTSKLNRGASRFVDAAWLVSNALFLSSWLPGTGWRVQLLRAFGAEVGRNVVIKPGVRVKFPWRLRIGDHSWIGEDVWIDNLAEVDIGKHVCVSQGAYLCTGSHDWSSESFDLITKPIILQNRVWVCAQATVGPGVVIGEGAVLGLKSCTSRHLSPWTINAGSPSLEVGQRTRHLDSMD
ncbi:WcaF family extracellular polysaccharide biosynthesis acetyltransferase [Aurantiacibacter rhizosphaerae]|uniref:Colanic acid biosynthesis acetyltransferase WcaF n=1 Tax=Aurantiacibacter rhizosphaerae TaxID=2691582 RepID=A0A844XAK1_9SPHN|nr:colanic acid biosynthesis acetyltransferase WcaF [Aurantiacibacter rhizosphaerae]